MCSITVGFLGSIGLRKKISEVLLNGVVDGSEMFEKLSYFKITNEWHYLVL